MRRLRGWDERLLRHCFGDVQNQFLRHTRETKLVEGKSVSGCAGMAIVRAHLVSERSAMIERIDGRIQRHEVRTGGDRELYVSLSRPFE